MKLRLPWRRPEPQRRVVPAAAVALRSAREEAALTQEQLARLAGISAKTIARLESFDVRPHPRTKHAIGEVLGIEPAAIWGGGSVLARPPRRRVHLDPTAVLVIRTSPEPPWLLGRDYGISAARVSAIRVGGSHQDVRS